MGFYGNFCVMPYRVNECSKCAYKMGLSSYLLLSLVNKLLSSAVGSRYRTLRLAPVRGVILVRSPCFTHRLNLLDTFTVSSVSKIPLASVFVIYLFLIK